MADRIFSANVCSRARAEACVERRRQHVGRHGFLDRGHDGPAALAEIVDQAGELDELRVRRQGDRRQIEQPRGDHAAAPPDFGDVGQIEVEALAPVSALDVGVLAGCRSPPHRPASGRIRCRCAPS